MRILVAIANHGTRNLKHLQVLLTEYRRIPFQVDIVVLSDTNKNLGQDVEVRVGLPTGNPWSLPFAHKPLFAERSNDYDLFIYTEDDILITEQNIRAFLQATEVLPEDHIAGFMRYEISPEGKRYYSTIHGHYHWDPNSVMRMGEFIFARFTNDHSGCFIITQRQLGKALASGGFLLGFRRGRYGYPETAATDIYTQCGFKKVICISHLHDFCLPHLPNVYIGKLGVETEIADREIEKLASLNGGGEVLGPLFKTDTGLQDASWNKNYYEFAREDLLALVPPGAKNVLSVGCGWGETESKLSQRGVKVVGIPLDCIVAVTAKAKGIEVVPPDLGLARQCLANRRFDCIIFEDSLHRFKDPVAVLKDYALLLDQSGVVVVSVPNFAHVSVLRKKLSGDLTLCRQNRSEAFVNYGLHFTTFLEVKQWLRQSELTPLDWNSELDHLFKWIARLSFGTTRRLLLENIVVVAKKTA